jgi:hypothetical protein
MHHIPPASQSVIEYSPDFPFLLQTVSHPIALVSPALFDIMGSRTTKEDLERAFVELGFSELWTISFNKYEFIDNLEREARHEKNGTVLFSACPDARELIADEFPHTFRAMTTAMPPADRTALAARSRHPDATLFWVSPCSSRAKALLRKEGPEGERYPYVDYLIPLYTIFPAILGRLGIEIDSFEVEESACDDGCCKDACATGRVEVVATAPVMRSYLDELSANSASLAERDHKKPVVEFIACPNGCSDGDWAPRLAHANAAARAKSAAEQKAPLAI